MRVTPRRLLRKLLLKSSEPRTLTRISGWLTKLNGQLEAAGHRLTSVQDRLETTRHRITRLNNDVNTKIRRLNAEAREIPDIRSFDGKERLYVCVAREATQWSDTIIIERNTPGMITLAECKYYSYIGRFYSGKGEVVELGSWVGRSTFYILQGLIPNPNFTGKKLHVYDDFVRRPAPAACLYQTTGLAITANGAPHILFHGVPDGSFYGSSIPPSIQFVPSEKGKV